MIIEMWKCRHCGEEMLAANRESHRDEHAWQHMRLKEQHQTAEDKERRAFIRKAAVAWWSFRPDNHDQVRAAAAWRVSQILWLEKPEDC